MRKVLFIGGTGTISTAIVQKLVEDGDWEVWLLNRGNKENPWGSAVHQITCDINDEETVLEQLGDLRFDTVCEFIGFTVADVARDYNYFHGRTKQYIYISSASAYHKPAANYIINEGTTLANPYWQYSRNKIACENYLMEQYRTEGFPVTIVRPSHTYGPKSIPVGIHGKNGSWQVIKRIREGKPVLIPGDGSSLWTLTFNKDFAVGFIGLMGDARAIGEAFQITGDETLTWNQIYGSIADALGVPLHPYHVASDFLAAVGGEYDLTGTLIGDKSVSVVFDNSKIKRIVPQMATTVPFSQGVRIALQYIQEHPDACQKEDPVFDQWCDRVIAALENAKASMKRI